jgi:hypothetical protein
MTQPRDHGRKLKKQERQILQGVVDGKGYYKTPTVNVDENENVITTLVDLYLSKIINFQREYDIPFISESSRHQVKYKWYVVTLDKNMPLKNLKLLLKNGKIA